eukprot:9949606-Alexandrium_andersonii.AAC.1
MSASLVGSEMCIRDRFGVLLLGFCGSPKRALPAEPRPRDSADAHLELGRAAPLAARGAAQARLEPLENGNW